MPVGDGQFGARRLSRATGMRPVRPYRVKAPAQWEASARRQRASPSAEVCPRLAGEQPLAQLLKAPRLELLDRFLGPAGHCLRLGNAATLDEAQLQDLSLLRCQPAHRAGQVVLVDHLI